MVVETDWGSDTRWVPPASGWWKLNCDAAISHLGMVAAACYFHGDQLDPGAWIPQSCY